MKNKFPELIPIFPLNGVIYFPKTNLPLNIFEQRYVELVNDTMKKDKLMGMIQSISDTDQVYKVGCLGKISDFKKIEDGRILINLTGLVRFEIKKEVKNEKKYREFEVTYNKFDQDLDKPENNLLEKNRLDYFIDKAKIFFNKNGLLLNWNEFGQLDHNQQINTLSMIAPVTNEEKQKLLETVTIKDKVETLLDIIKFYSYENSNKTTIQ